jgi:phosphoserine phosphatase
MSDTKLICFDLDDTLIREIHSVMYLSILNNRVEETIEIEKREANGEITWIEADYLYAELAYGLNIEKVSTEFNNVLKPINNISNVITTLHRSGFKCILITAGPKQVAEFACKIWRLDGYYGSDYEIVDRKFTGRIINHMGDKGKITCLQEYCKKYEINSNNCIAIGDGVSDIPLFEYCGCSIAINYSNRVIGKATHYIKTDDLSDILSFIIE